MVDGATVVGRDPDFIQPVDPRVLKESLLFNQIKSKYYVSEEYKLKQRSKFIEMVLWKADLL